MKKGIILILMAAIICGTVFSQEEDIQFNYELIQSVVFGEEITSLTNLRMIYTYNKHGYIFDIGTNTDFSEIGLNLYFGYVFIPYQNNFIKTFISLGGGISKF